MTPIFELSSKLFPSSDVRGYENRWNHVLLSGPILPFADKTTTRQRKVDGWMDGWEEGGKFSLPLFLLFVLLFSRFLLWKTEHHRRRWPILPQCSLINRPNGRTNPTMAERARRCLTHSRDHLASLPTRYLPFSVEDWIGRILLSRQRLQLRCKRAWACKTISSYVGSVNLRKYAKPIWNLLS